jgi:methylated-DNA-[protein]-cysteine S-methyltransferase
LHLINFPAESRTKEPRADWRRDDSLFVEAFRQLHAYFAGELTRFDLPLRLAGTAFQNKVWTALCDIPFGETISYGALASRIGKPTASRVVGGANGANPLSIVVPCHRVIGSNRSLTGFGGGIEAKRFLLAHEQRGT